MTWEIEYIQGNPNILRDFTKISRYYSIDLGNILQTGLVSDPLSDPLSPLNPIHPSSPISPLNPSSPMSPLFNWNDENLHGLGSNTMYLLCIIALLIIGRFIYKDTKGYKTHFRRNKKYN